MALTKENAGYVLQWQYGLGCLAIAGYLIVLFILGGLGWQHLILPAFIWACLSARAFPRRFMRDWWPIILFWLSYDAMRLAGPILFPRVAVEDLFRWERALFLAPDGTIWPFYLTHWLGQAAENPWIWLLKGYSNLIYLSHVFVFPVVLLIVWLRRSDLLFRRLLWSFTALHIMGICIYWGYPAAPPWWVFENGFAQPTLARSTPMGFEAGSVLAGIFHFSANKFAAVPSLHGAYPALMTCILALHDLRSRWIVLTAFYAVSMWFACVLLNQHYIVDLIIGVVLAAIAIPFALIPKEAHAC
jgi:hypothetical protein